MKWVLYANAHEMKLGEDGHISNTEFLCGEKTIHITRKTLWKNGNTEISWGEPSCCNESCNVWIERNLGMPEDIEKKCQELSKLEKTEG